jgi:hypothetical protein
MMKFVAGLVSAAMLLAACGDSDDTTDALSAVCDSQAAVAGQLLALELLDPVVNTTEEYKSALEDLQDSVDDLREARSDLREEDVENVENVYDELKSELEDLDDVPLADADAVIGAASDAQISELAAFYDEAYANSSCPEPTTTTAESTTTTAADTTTTAGGEESTTTAADTTTTAGGEESTTSSEAPAEGPKVELSVDGATPVVFVVTSCVNPGETSLTLDAQTEEDENPVLLALEAEGATGTIVLSGGDEAEGTVDELMVGDTGEITASGQLTAADDSAEPAGYTLTGNCT